MIAPQRRAHRLWWSLAAPLLLAITAVLLLARPAAPARRPDPAHTPTTEVTP